MQLLSRFHIILFRFSKRQRVFGIDVGVFGANAAESTIIRSKVEEALSLMQTYDPRRFRYLQRDMKRIMVFGSPEYQARWHQELALCELTDSYVLSSNTTPAILVSFLVHEAMHARLHRWGFGYEEDKRVCIEQICFKASIAFARRLPESEAASRDTIIRVTMQQIARDPNFWTDQSWMEIRLVTLRDLGCPVWLISIIRWILTRAKKRNGVDSRQLPTSSQSKPQN